MTLPEVPVKRRYSTKLTAEQLEDLADSDISLLDIDPETGQSSIMDGLSGMEYHDIIIRRQYRKREVERWTAILTSMGKAANTNEQ
jgi:hypothetical protein